MFSIFKNKDFRNKSYQHLPENKIQPLSFYKFVIKTIIKLCPCVRVYKSFHLTLFPESPRMKRSQMN